jgi:S-disulfanyl-L-cysteine oxidoreductase SoxD
MLKAAVGFLLVASVATWMGATMNHGCQDVRSAFTKLSYPHTRDMRRTVAITPNKVSLRAPESLSVWTGGREAMPDPNLLMTNREVMAARYVATAPDDSSLARGERAFQRLCVPCHGASMKGDGPVAAKFMPPPDLLGATTRGRADGYIYTYIRFGGPIMPRYGHALSEKETWDVIHFVRHRQRTTPR